MDGLTGYTGLFLTALGAATLLPMQSEAVLVGLLLNDRHMVWTLVAVAAFGNTLGSTINWLLGLYVERLQHKRWFPASEKGLARARRTYHRYGRWSLLLSWVPIVGDPLTVIAGIMREPLWSFLPIVALAKTLRYAVLAAPFWM